MKGGVEADGRHLMAYIDRLSRGSRHMCALKDVMIMRTKEAAMSGAEPFVPAPRYPLAARALLRRRGRTDTGAVPLFHALLLFS